MKHSIFALEVLKTYQARKFKNQGLVKNREQNIFMYYKQNNFYYLVYMLL